MGSPAINEQQVVAFLEGLFGDDLHARRVLSLSLATLGVIHAASLSVYAIGQALAVARGKKGKHGVKQVDRLLSNTGVDVWSLFSLWVPYVMGQRTEAVVALDWTDFDDDDHTTLVASLRTRHGRSTPLVWLTVHKSALKGMRNDAEDSVLLRLREVIAPEVKVTLLADRGFADQKLYALLTQLGFSYVVRFRQRIIVTSAQGERRTAAEWVPKSGHLRKLKGACVTADEVEVAAVVCVKKKGMKEPWCLATSLGESSGAQVVALHAGGFTIERMVRDLMDWQEMLEPTLRALSSLEPEQVDAAAQDVPALVGHLSDALAATVTHVRKGVELTAKVLVLRDALLSFPLALEAPLLASEAPSASALLGVGLRVGGDGVMMGTRLVVSAEWVEMMRQLVRAGVLSLPVVSAAVRIQAGQVMLAQAHGELPRGVREALGDGPEVGAMHETGKAGAGMAEPPRHHVMPKEFREWFEKRGFTGEMDIDEFCVKLEQAHHEAIHGGGDWTLGRTWPGEWNRMIMDRLSKAESEAGRMLTRNEVLRIVARNMRDYKIPMNFVSGRGR